MSLAGFVFVLLFSIECKSYWIIQRALLSIKNHVFIWTLCSYVFLDSVEYLWQTSISLFYASLDILNQSIVRRRYFCGHIYQGASYDLNIAWGPLWVEPFRFSHFSPQSPDAFFVISKYARTLYYLYVSVRCMAMVMYSVIDIHLQKLADVLLTSIFIKETLDDHFREDFIELRKKVCGLLVTAVILVTLYLGNDIVHILFLILLRSLM